MCVNFTDLNKSCPKDCYPLPEIDWKIESLCGYPFKCFLDAYKWYHQIKMTEEDEEKTAFHISQGVYCYTKIPFGLKNTGATYQRPMDKAFEKHIGRNLEVYVDDLVIKSHTEQEILRDIEETFQTLRKINMKLHPKKCTFEAEEGMFLDFIAETSDNDTPLTKIPTEKELPEPSTLLTDGSSCLEGSGARLILTNSEGMEFTYALIFDSQLNQQIIHKKEHIVIQYLEKAKALISGFIKFSIEQVLRSENTKADALSKIASTSFAHLTKQALVDILKEDSINEKEIFAIVKEEGHTWMTPLLEYLIDGTLPAEAKKALAIKIKSRQYAVISSVLYRKLFLEPWLRCVGPLQSEYVVREIHEGSCSMHSGPRSVVAKAISLEYYWLTMHKDVRSIIQICDDFQVHRSVPKNPQ
ncbi:reverse transcriptase domain-containing protein [Tanacetum coccineum]